MQKNIIELDGSTGEGGGQILRSALSLSMCTGQPFRINNIRSGRKKPGLLRQHLTAVQSSAAICGAQVNEGRDAALGDSQLQFVPGPITAGDYRFAIGSAGSCTLVLQTLLPALLLASGPSMLHLSGGTHNPLAPSADFLDRAFLPLLRRMGTHVDLTLQQHGFYPAGGGEIVMNIEPCGRLQPLHLRERGEPVNSWAESIVVGIPRHVAERELAVVANLCKWPEENLRLLQPKNLFGQGNALNLNLQFTEVCEVVTAMGERRLPAETVAYRAVHEAQQYLSSKAAVGEYLADQLLLPLALAGEGSFTATCFSRHAQTNAEVIERFLPVKIATRKEDKHRIECRVEHIVKPI